MKTYILYPEITCSFKFSTAPYKDISPRVQTLQGSSWALAVIVLFLLSQQMSDHSAQGLILSQVDK